MYSGQTINFKTIADDLRTLADHHKQLNSFGLGEIDQLSYWTESRDKQDNVTFSSPIYPFMYVVPSTCTIEMTQPGSSFMVWELNILVMDLVERDLSNQIDILSDTKQILDDIIAQYRLSVESKFGCYNSKYYVEDNVVCNPFLEQYDDLTCGWNGIIRIKTMMPMDRCSAAFNDFVNIPPC